MHFYRFQSQDDVSEKNQRGSGATSTSDGVTAFAASVEQSRQEIMVSHVVAEDLTNRCMIIKWSISFIAIIITVFIYSNKRKFLTEI